MGPHVVKWKPITVKNVRNTNCEIPFPELIDASSGWTTLERIFQMEEKKPITFMEAAIMAHKKFDEAIESRRFGYSLGHCNWYPRNFLFWISSLGYHIELTGDEFELYTVGVPRA